MNEKLSLHATVDRFEGDKAVLVFDDLQKISVSKNFLSENIKEGQIINVCFNTVENEEKSKREVAVLLLNEILNGS